MTMQNKYEIIADEGNFEVLLNGVEVYVAATRREAEAYIKAVQHAS